MKTSYINPFGQSAYEIIQSYGNITQIAQTTQEINNVIENTYNQDPKKINTIKELCYDKIRHYYQDQLHKKTHQYNYLYNTQLTTADTIATHTLLQATAITYGHDSYEADNMIQIITNITQQKIEKQYQDELVDQTLNEYLDIHNTHLTDIMPLLNNQTIHLNKLLLKGDKLVLTYDDFLTEYEEYLLHRRPEMIYGLLCYNMKKDLLLALIERQTREYMKRVENKLKQVEPAPIIQEVGRQIRTIQQEEKENTIKHGGWKTKTQGKYTNYNDDQPTQYIPEAFPPCIKKALEGIRSGGRNYTISLVLTPFLSYARLYPGVYARNIKNPKITDFDPKLEITREEIIPLIYQAANNCRPPLFKDQPQEKHNINSKLGFGENNIQYENTNKTPWYTPPNCKNIQNSQPQLCTPCQDCKKIGNPLSYYNRKRKIISRQKAKENGTTTITNGNT